MKRLHKQRAKKLLNNDNDHLLHEVAGRLIERLTYDITPAFENVLLLDCAILEVAHYLHGRKGTKRLICADLIGGEHSDNTRSPLEGESGEAFDLIINFMGLHWINDVPGALIQIRRMLSKNGLFLAAFPGGKTLSELRHAALEGETTLTGGASPRVSPMIDVRDAGALLQRAGLALPVADSEIITLLYTDALALMRDLRAMGETNALLKREKNFTSRTTLSAIAQKYQELYANQESLIPATFEIITLTGWNG